MAGLGEIFIKGTGSFVVQEYWTKQGELVTDGSFANGLASWNSAGAMVSNGICTLDRTLNANPNIYQAISSAILGRRFQFKYTITSNSLVGGSGSFVLYNDAANVMYRSDIILDGSVGTHTIQFDYNGFGTRLYIRALNYTSGSISITNISVTEVLPLNFKQGQRYLSCTSTGNTAIPCTQSTGYWEFDVFKGSASDVIRVDFISSSYNSAIANGYRFAISSANGLYIQKITGGSATTISNSADNTISTNTWYRIRIERTNAGVFTLLAKGSSLTPTAGRNGFSLITMTSGTNPTAADSTYFTNSYLVYYATTSDGITNFDVRDGLYQY